MNYKVLKSLQTLPRLQSLLVNKSSVYYNPESQKFSSRKPNDTIVITYEPGTLFSTEGKVFYYKSPVHPLTNLSQLTFVKFSTKKFLSKVDFKKQIHQCFGTDVLFLNDFTCCHHDTLLSYKNGLFRAYHQPTNQSAYGHTLEDSLSVLDEHLLVLSAAS